MKLRIHTYDAEPYPINDFSTLEDAVEAEAITVASQADSRHLDEGTDAERDALRERVQRDALRLLASTGRYTDPLGILWTLDADESEG